MKNYQGRRVYTAQAVAIKYPKLETEL